MKKILTLLVVFSTFHVSAQKTIVSTEIFKVEGKVKQHQSFSLQSLSDFPVIETDSIVITNHLLEKKGTIKKIKGVLLKDVLNKVAIDQENSKLLSEYYFVCVASDNYKVVFSWNEIFNNETGSQVIIITEQGGKKSSLMENRIALITLNDQATGRRYVKGLQKIIIERVQ